MQMPWEQAAFLWNKNMWPTSSSDINPQDLLASVKAKQDTNRLHPNNKASIIMSIIKLFNTLCQRKI